MDVDLNAIAIFVSVVDAGSFIGAARASGVAKSTVARRVDELEAALGVRLIQRSTRQLSLTEAGRAFYERSRRIVSDIADATADVSAHQHEPRGRLRLTTSVLLAETYVGAWSVEYLRAHPAVELDLVLASREVDLIAEGFDLALRVGPIEPSSHIMRRLAPAPHFLCASPQYLAQHGAPESTADLQRHAHIVFSADRSARPWSLANDAGESVSVSASGRLMVNSYPIALDACVNGFGIAHLPSFVCCDAIRSGQLVQLLAQWSAPTRWVHALYPSRHHVSAVVRTFLDFISAKLDPPPWLI